MDSFRMYRQNKNVPLKSADLYYFEFGGFYVSVVYNGKRRINLFTQYGLTLKRSALPPVCPVTWSKRMIGKEKISLAWDHFKNLLEMNMINNPDTKLKRPDARFFKNLL